MKQYDYLDGFLRATKETFEMLFGLKVENEDAIIKKFGDPALFLSSTVGFSGNSRGLVALSFNEETICTLAGKIYGVEYKELCDEVVDTSSEIVNVIAGYVKQYLPEYDFEISLPSVISGHGHSLQTIKGAESLIINLNSEIGKIHMEVVLASN